MYYMNCFFLYSILGYLSETILSLINSHNYDSGILYGPYAPIYGIGAVIILILYNFLSKKIKNKFCRYLILFIIVCILLSTLELLCGYLIELIFHKVYWNYNNHIFNIGKYTSLEFSLLWGISSLIFLFIIHPIFKKIINKIPNLIIEILTAVFIFDIIFTIIFKSYLFK